MFTGRSSSPNPWVASLLSALFPGLGHTYAGERARGRILILIDLALITLLVIFLVFFQLQVGRAWFSLNALSLIMVGNLALLSYRAWAAYDAYNLVAPDTRLTGPMASAFGLLIAIVVVVPHLAVGYYNVVQYRLVSDVFAPTPTTTIPQGDPSETVRPGDTTTTTPQPALWDGMERVNIVLMGTDRSGGRTDSVTLVDTTILVSIDPETGDSAMISLPRNMTEFPLPEGMGSHECDCFPQLLNDLFQRAVEAPSLYPGAGEPGPRAMKAAVGEILDVDVHYYAMVNMDGFVGIVDALGGVDIYVPTTIVDEIYPHEDGSVVHMEIEQGQQLLDGHHALAYVRIRRHADDFARMNRQRCVLGALAEQSSPFEILASYGAIADVLRTSLETDIPRDRLPDFINLLPNISMDRIGVLHINMDYAIGPAEVRGTLYDMDRVKADAQAVLADPTAGADVSLEEACD